MNPIIKKWKQFLKEQEEQEPAPVLDLSKELDSGFCDFNPLINQYAQSSPDGLAEMLIFVVATQQMRWYDVVPKFPLLMQHLREKDILLDPKDSFVNDQGKTIYNIPKSIAQLTLGPRKNAIQYMWENREGIYSTLKPMFSTYNKGGEDSLAKEEALFNIYLEFIKLPGLGLPKAAFAAQLIVGRLGCIDSINLNLYKGLDPEGQLITYDKTGRPSFKTPGKTKKTGIVQITKGGVKLAQKYVQFLKHIAEMTGTTEASVSKQLWNSWVELVALKINKKDDITVIMPGGKEYTVPNDYSKNISKADVNPSAAFRKKYIGRITGKDISRQHDPRKMFEGAKKWDKYVKGLINEALPFGGYEPAAIGGVSNRGVELQPHPGNMETGVEEDTTQSIKAVMHQNGKVLLLKCNEDKRGWDLPGGHIKEDENSLQALRREVFEETGLQIINPKIIHGYRHKNKIFAEGGFGGGEVQLSEEHDSHAFMSLEEIKKQPISEAFLKAIELALGEAEETRKVKIKIIMG